MTCPPTVWTVGHSNHGFDEFANLVSAEQIEFLVDVRSYPYSRFAPQFNRDELQRSMADLGVGYLYLGDELGGRPSRPEHYDGDGHALYAEMAGEPAFRAAIDRLVRGAREHRLALVCSEADPADCHRRLLVGKVLCDRGVLLRHILADGTVRVEETVDLAAQAQPALFGDTHEPWRSTQLVSHRRRLSTSSRD